MAKILIVDDEQPLREVLGDILAIAGYNIVKAGDGKEGLEKIFSEKPDLVLLDCSMPEMDGYEVLSRMKKNPETASVPVIMLTAMSDENDERKGFDLGADDYITKPFKSAVLLARIMSILENKNPGGAIDSVTCLPGKNAVETEAEKRLQLGKRFAFLYISIANFKNFNDKYGRQKSEEVLKYTADCLRSSLEQDENKEDFIGYIGVNKFVIMTQTDKAEKAAESFIKSFDKGILNFYGEKDKKNGYIISNDGQYNKTDCPVMTVSVAIISTQISNLSHFSDISKRAAELENVAGRNKKSSYIFERRR